MFEAQPNGVKDSNSEDAVHETVAQLNLSVYVPCNRALYHQCFESED